MLSQFRLPPNQTPTPDEPPRDRPLRKKCRLTSSAAVSTALRSAVSLLESEFEERKATSADFPPLISPHIVRSSISKHDNIMATSTRTSVCASCGELVPTAHIHNIDCNDDRLHIIGDGRLDCCARRGTSWHFCGLCFNALSHSKIPKFSAANGINMTMCQSYPSVLEGLTAVEECLIARCHPVGAVFKLRPGGRASPVNYYALRGHMIVIPQDPGPLLSILPNADLSLQSLIKVCWLGKTSPSLAELNPLFQVRKDNVLAALQFLVDHNPVYKDVNINRRMIDDWRQEFIPADIMDNITILSTDDTHEREGYAVSLENGNHENDFAAAQDAATDSDRNEPFLTASVMSDVNGERSRPDSYTLDALLQMVNGTSDTPSDTNVDVADDNENADYDDSSPDGVRSGQGEPVITYSIQNRPVLLSAFSDPHYFTGAFPTLFPYSIGGHLKRRDVAVSLEAFAPWSLRHHSRRYIQVLMKLLLCIFCRLSSLIY